MKRRLSIGLGLALVALVLLLATPRAAPEIEVIRDVVYGVGGETPLLLDLAMPKAGDGPFPVVVFLHGGGWLAGNRQEMNHFIEGVAGLGYVGITVEYRLVPAARFPAQVEDCKAAVRWVRANAAKYRMNPERVGAVGFSAGGHLASMIGVTDGKDGFDGSGGNPGLSSRVQAVVNFFGPTDFTTRDWPRDLETEVIEPFLGGSFAARADTYRRASPINYVTKDAAPFLFFHGSDDKLVPVDQSIRLGEKLKSAGVAAEVHVLAGEGHGFTDANNQKAMRQMLDFLDARLKQ
ncbi:MAG: alpha/beta hydrolase [Betaproteobacteria bacterium]